MSFDDTVTIAVDAMGGDHAPGVVLEGVASALEKDERLEVILVGPADVVEPFASAHARCVAQPASEIIAMDEHPAQAVRKKKDSSIVVGCRAVKEGRAQGFFSAGSTGACLAGATLGIGRIKGVQRPALCSVIPSPIAPVVMTDIGANADCKPEYLVQFARMAAIYAEKIVGIKNPRIALLNIGEEDTKGSQFAQQAFSLMKENVPGFVGNAEGNDIIDAAYDVIVTDGFTGNVTLKTIEGTSKALFSALKGVMTSSLKAKMGGLALKNDLKELKDSISADTYGGAPLLGVAGICLVGHGSSNATAIENGVLASADMVRKDVAGLIAEAVGK
ncbi:phosphate acyltransferase PlsX [uncultured Slackia sp.]|uniref:phosphate acyltransferase PlsX n=1 Tax=uncultured Slackia sp. TaxID=665903 RepID=UPI0026E033C5|nr:phosphate acyltransferase PlsX [uncultured Slackia sp.]